MTYNYSKLNILLAIIVFILTYSVGILSNSYLSHAVALVYTICFPIILFLTHKNNLLDKRFLIVFPFIWGIIMFIGAYILNKEDSAFFIYDTYQNFFPKSEKLIALLSGSQQDKSPLDKNWSNHFLIFDVINSVPLYFWGRSPLPFILLLASYKSVTSFFIYKSSQLLFSNKRVASLCGLTYLLTPTFLYHTTVLFKEAFLHLFFSIFIYLFIRVQKNEKPIKHILLLLITSIILVWERIYLVIPIALSISCIPLFSELKRIYKVLIYLSLLTIASLFLGILITFFDLNNIFPYLKSTKDFYGTYSDVNKAVNVDIPYILGFLKISFSPYFTLNKFELFKGYSNILTWGSIPNFFLLLMFYFGIIKSSLGSKKHIPFLLVTLSHIAFIAYLAPYAFRQRDSIAPLIAIYSGWAFSYLTENSASIKFGLANILKRKPILKS